MLSGATPAVSRRHVLIGLAVLGAAACGSPPEPPPVDPLIAQRDLADRDSAMAAGAVSSAGPFYGPLLKVVTDERAAHAAALSSEITRVAGSTSSSTPIPMPTPTTPAPPPPTRQAVVTALRESADSAKQLAPNLSGYRAGLLGSIAAACTTAVTVPLASTAPTP